jgi:hypothetical protein
MPNDEVTKPKRKLVLSVETLQGLTSTADVQPDTDKPTQHGVGCKPLNACDPERLAGIAKLRAWPR